MSLVPEVFRSLTSVTNPTDTGSETSPLYRPLPKALDRKRLHAGLKEFGGRLPIWVNGAGLPGET